VWSSDPDAMLTMFVASSGGMLERCSTGAGFALALGF
jgi:hypothetical protein